MHSQRVEYLLACIWRIGEAVVFFVLPDALITRAALGCLRSELLTAAFALAGALLRGTINYLWGAIDLDGTCHRLDVLPVSSIGALYRAQHALTRDGVFADIANSFSGVPCKMLAVHAASAGVSLPVFVLDSIPVRGIPFVLLMMTTCSLVRLRSHLEREAPPLGMGTRLDSVLRDLLERHAELIRTTVSPLRPSDKQVNGCQAAFP